MAASALCVRPADCLLGGKPFFGAHRGVRAAPAPRRPLPQQQQYVQVPTTASMSAPVQPRPAHGRANGRRQRRRRSPRGAGSPSKTEERVMENVVILKRGEQIIQAKVAAAPELLAANSGAQAEKAEMAAAADKRAVKAGTVVVAADQHSPRVDTPVEPVAAAKQSSARAENAEPVVAAADTLAEKAEQQQQRGAEATNAAIKAKVVAAADRHVPQAREKDAKSVAAPKRSGGRGKKKPGPAPPVMYSGPPFTAAPEPHELPIPLLLLNGRGARLRPRDGECARAA